MSKLVALLSGGIDSPVAVQKMMREYDVVLVHFHNFTPNSEAVKDKLEKLAKTLTKYQKKVKLWMIPFGELQRELIKDIPAKQRMIVYRRFMFRIAEKIAKKEKAIGFVTGDSLAQVASQTLDNLNVIYNVAGLPVYHPLIGTDKLEITQIAKDIGTYEISILPYEDCCSFLIAEHPETHAKLEDIEEVEKGLKIDQLVKNAYKKAEMLTFK